jgi:hypothetical protein
MMDTFRRSLPWSHRIDAKIVIARLPIPYLFWKRLHLFEHGDMNQPQKALAGFLGHARTAGVLHEESALPYLSVDNDFTVLNWGQVIHFLALLLH